MVLTVGTFLGGRIHVGLDNYQGGRAGDPPSNRLAARLRELPLRVGAAQDRHAAAHRRPHASTTRAMTGAARRCARRRCFRSSGAPVSIRGRSIVSSLQTNERTHEIIRAATDRSPMFTGVIEGVGPALLPVGRGQGACASPTRPRTRSSSSPRAWTPTRSIPNGISTSLPFDVQYEFVRSIRGFEQAHLTRPGYAIEYDYLRSARPARPRCETRAIGGLFFAGQINGTTGYEEAAAQGLLAGINAALQVRGREPWMPKRSEAYLGRAGR